MRYHRSLILTLALLAAAGLLLLGAAALSSAQAAEPQACQPVTDAALTYTPTLVYPDAAVIFSGEILTGSLPVTYTWQFGDGSTPITGTTALSQPLFTVTHSYTRSGVFSVTLSAWNTCTLLAPYSTTARITVEARPCLTLTGLTLSYTPSQVYAHQEALFSGQVITGSPPLTYTWRFGDCSPPLTGTSVLPVFTAAHTFTAAQVYTVEAAAWNACTITPTYESLTLTVAPCRVITEVGFTYWPTVARAGEVLTFTAEVSDNVAPWDYAWSWGDGLTATGKVVTHVYPAQVPTLTYTVVLTAANPCNQHLTTTTLHLLPWRYFEFLPLVARKLEPPRPPSLIGYGANVSSAGHASYLGEMGFDWAKGFVNWQSSVAGVDYFWGDVDNQMRAFLPHTPKVLLRIHGRWPPLSEGDRAAFRNFAQALARHVSEAWRTEGLETMAYEIWNEPNLDYEWGGSPNAAAYTALLKAGYEGIKAGDPEALVISAGLAPTGGSLTDSPAETARVIAQARWLYGATQVVPDLTFLRQMYAHGAKGYMDGVGTHPYGGNYAPDTPRSEVGIPIYFRRAEEQHQVMLDNGDDSPMWNTEFGWVVETGCDLGEHEWMEVSEARQAEYLAAAYAYAEEYWPWMGPMFLFNLDFATVYWYQECDPMRWYSITYRHNPNDGASPILKRPAYYSLRDMPKHSAW